MIVDRSDAAAVKPLPRYPDGTKDDPLVHILEPGDRIDPVQIPPPANRIASPQYTPSVLPNGGLAPTPRAGFPTWAKIAIGVAGVLFLIGGVRA